MSALRQQAEQLLRQNLQLRGQLLGTDYMPELGVDTLDAGPQGFGEGLANVFGLYDAKPKLTKIIQERESRQAQYNQAIKNRTEAEKAKVKAEAEATKAATKAEEAAETEEIINRDLEIVNRQGQILSQLQKEAGEIALDQSVRQTQALLPYIDQAQSRSIQRNLAASERFKAFKEQLPTTIQAIMSAKQQQLNTASDAFLKEAQAAATQQQAASNFASLGTGRRFG